MRGRSRRRDESRELDEIRAAIRNRGLRATPTRVAVLEELKRNAAAMSHADLVEVLSTIQDRTTIFRALIVLAKANLLYRVDVGDRVWRYKIASDSSDRKKPVTSFVCTSCGAVDEVKLRFVASEGAPRSVLRGAYTLFVHGVCDRCARRNQA